MNNKQQSISGRILKTFGKYLLVALAISGLVSCGSSNSVDEPILIKFPHVTSPNTPKGLAAERFKSLVEERLAGRVVVEVYPSGQLMNDDDSIEALAFGEVQMIATSLSKFDRLTNKFQVFDLPFLFPNLDVIEKFQTGQARSALLGAMSSHGLQGLGFWHNGMKHFTGPVPMSDPEAATGLKFRIMESDVLQAQILQIGGSPQKMAFVEVYQALQTGAVDAQENTWSNIYSSKFYEVQKHLTVTNHGYVGYLIAVNSAFWSGLPGDIRTELEAILDEVSAWANQRAKSINEEALNKIIDSEKSEITYLTAEQLMIWQKKMRPLWTDFSDKIGPDIISAAQSASN